MHPDLQFTLLIIAIFAFYYIYWLVKTLQENKKMRRIREKGQEIRTVITKIDSNLRRLGNRYDVQVTLNVPGGTRTLVNYPKIRKSPYQPGTPIDIIYSDEFRTEYIFADERALRVDRPFGVVDGSRITPWKLALRTAVVWAVCAAIIVLGIYFFGVNGVYYQ